MNSHDDDRRARAEVVESGEERELITTLDGPNGTAEVFQITPPGRGIGDAKYEVTFDGKAVREPSIGEAMTVAEELVGVKKA